MCWLVLGVAPLGTLNGQREGICMYSHINMCPVSVYWKWWDHIKTSNSNLIPLYSLWLGSDTSCQAIMSHINTLFSPHWNSEHSALGSPSPTLRADFHLFSPKCLNTGLFRKGREENGKKSKNQRWILNHRWTLNLIFSAHKPPGGLHEETCSFLLQSSHLSANFWFPLDFLFSAALSWGSDHLALAHI